jgi:hypothetical protein
MTVPRRHGGPTATTRCPLAPKPSTSRSPRSRRGSCASPATAAARSGCSPRRTRRGARRTPSPETCYLGREIEVVNACASVMVSVPEREAADGRSYESVTADCRIGVSFRIRGALGYETYAQTTITVGRAFSYGRGPKCRCRSSLIGGLGLLLREVCSSRALSCSFWHFSSRVGRSEAKPSVVTLTPAQPGVRPRRKAPTPLLDTLRGEKEKKKRSACCYGQPGCFRQPWRRRQGRGRLARLRAAWRGE